MPWEAVIAGGFPTLAFVLFGYLLYTLITNASAAFSNTFQEARKAEREAAAEARRAERGALDQVRVSNLQILMEVRKSSLAFIQTVNSDLRSRRFEVYNP